MEDLPAATGAMMRSERRRYRWPVGLAVALVTMMSLACRSSADMRIRKAWQEYDKSLAALVEAQAPYAALDASEEVRLFPVTSLDATAGPPGAESIDLPGTFRVEPQSRVVDAETASAVRRLLKARSSWRRAVSLCIFEPSVAYAFPDRQSLMLIVCFQCREVAAVRSNMLLGKWMLDDAAATRVLELSRHYLPTLPGRLPD